MSAMPRLRHLMEGYFHQDYDLDGDYDAAILKGFARSAGRETVAATIGEIDAVVAQPVAGLLDRFRKATGEWNMTIADDDAGARDWLLAARQVLKEAETRPAALASLTPSPRSVLKDFGETVWGTPPVAVTSFAVLTDLAQRFLARRDVYATEEAALEDYRRSHWPDQVERAVAEADAFLALPVEGAGRRWAAVTSRGGVTDDVACREVSRLREILASPEPTGTADKG